MATARNSQVLRMIPLLLIVPLFCPLAYGKVIHVDDDGQADFDSIQAGIDNAEIGDTVLVMPGEYVITQPITFQGKAITVKSEAGREGTTVRTSTPADTSRGSVVVFENGETAASVLEGFTITGGRGSSLQGSLCGGGIIFNTSSGTVKNCTLAENRAEHGGGLFIYSGSSPILIECAMVENTATNGGGLAISSRSSLTLIDCKVVENTAKNGGGVMVGEESSTTLTNCIIRDNSATGVTLGVDGYGGGLSCLIDSSLNLTNCTIKGNSAVRAGGGGHIWQNSSAIMTGCNISENSVGESGGGLNCAENSSATMANCIIRDNSSALGQGGVCCTHGSITMSYCEITGNEAQDEAGGIYIGYGSAAILSNCLIAMNTSYLLGGGGLMCSRPGTSVTISNCTIYVSTPFVLSPADGEFSVLAWIKGIAPGQVILSQQGGLNWLMADAIDGSLRTDLRKPETTGRGASPPGPPLTSQAVVTDGDWHQVGFVRDGVNRILFVDNMEVACDTAESLESADGGLYMGAASGLEPGTFFSGLIDDVQIYNRAVKP